MDAGIFAISTYTKSFFGSAKEVIANEIVVSNKGVQRLEGDDEELVEALRGAEA